MMLKTIILAGAVMMSGPALAQEAGSSSSSSGATDTAVAASQNSAAQASAAGKVDTASSQSQAVTADQVAQVINAEFPTYDADKTGDLNKDEFGKWMIALRSASEPGASTASAEMQSWVGQAFASADKDKSSAVTKEELAGFLTQAVS